MWRNAKSKTAQYNFDNRHTLSNTVHQYINMTNKDNIMQGNAENKTAVQLR